MKKYAFLPESVRKRLKATGITRRQIASHMKQRNNQHFYQQLAGKTKAAEDLITEITRLTDQLESGELRVDKHFPRVTPNAGGTFSHVDDAFEPPLPPEPTDAKAGSPEKIAVMIARGVAGYAVLHPDDNRMHIAIGPSSHRMDSILDAIDAAQDEFDAMLCGDDDA